jgi:hypothetical protein
VLLTAKLADNKARRKYRDGGSPNMRASRVLLHLQMLICMRWQLRGEDGCVSRYNGKFKRICNRLRKAMHGICSFSEEEKATQLTDYKGFGRNAFVFRKDSTIQILEDNIDIAVIVTRRKTHGRDRTDLRRELNYKIKKMEES